jgi:hypothetical protein
VGDFLKLPLVLISIFFQCGPAGLAAKIKLSPHSPASKNTYPYFTLTFTRLLFQLLVGSCSRPSFG